MNKFKRISVKEAEELIQKEDVTIVDIRDRDSYLNGHINNSIHLTGNNAEDFLATLDREKPLIIYCYHGKSSQNAVQFFAEKGVAAVYSIDGGFEAWRVKDVLSSP